MRLRQASKSLITTGVIGVLFMLVMGLNAQSDSGSSDAQPSIFDHTQPRIEPSSLAQPNREPMVPSMSGPQIASLSSELNQLLNAWQNGQIEGVARANALNLDVSGSRVATMFVMLESAAADPAINAIEAAGGEVTSHYERWIDALVPVLALENLAEIPNLSVIQRPIDIMPLDTAITPVIQETLAQRLAGSSLTEGVEASNAAEWQSNGIDGSEINVAILDVFEDYTIAQMNGELPPEGRIATLGTLVTNSRHGTAVAEIVYDMAPGVNMIFASPTTATEMASRITELANYPVSTRPKIITSSISFYNAEPGDGSGAVSQAINYAISQGILVTQAAGDQALTSWKETYNDPSGNGWHKFTGIYEDNPLNDGFLIPEGYPIRLFLRWNDWPVSDQDYNLYLYRCEEACDNVIAWSQNAQTGTQPPIEQIQVNAPVTGYYSVTIHTWDATENLMLDLMAHDISTLYFHNPTHSLIDPATGTGTFGVASLHSAAPYLLEAASSQGPALGAGGTLAGGNDQPRLSGFSAVDTWSYGADGFNGTSAAAPHVAGAAALMWDRYPTYTVAQIKSELESRAIDMGEAGYDHLYGAGRLWLGAPPATMDAGVTLQGRPGTPHVRWSVPLNVIVKPVGGGIAIFNGTVTTDQSGHFTLNAIEPGTYNIWVKHNHSLATSTQVTLVADSQTINFGILREGDADNNNIVTINDFSILASTFGKASADAGYDARADFNGDNVITITDFSLLASNFGTSGPAAP